MAGYTNRGKGRFWYDRHLRRWREWMGKTGTLVLDLPGSSGNYASTPDSAAISITGDLDMRAYLALDDWSPAAQQFVLSKNNRDYSLAVDTSGTLRVVWFEVGLGGLQAKASSVATGFANGSAHWIRATLDADNGSSGTDITFYTSDDGVVWTQLGTVQTLASTTVIRDTAAELDIGANNSGAGGFLAANVFQVKIYDGIAGTLVADFNATRDAGVGDTSVVSTTTGETWTINQSGDPQAELVAL